MLEYDLLHRLRGIRSCASTTLASNSNLFNSSKSVGNASLLLPLHSIFACNENVSTSILMQPNYLAFYCSGDRNYYSSAVQCSVKYLTGGNSYSIKPSIDLSNNKHCACYTGGNNFFILILRLLIYTDVCLLHRHLYGFRCIQ